MCPSAAYTMGLFCVTEHMVDGHENSPEFFEPPKRTEFELWSYFFFYSAEGNLIGHSAEHA